MTSSTDAWPQGLTLIGGIPTRSQDLAASIIFTIAFAALLPLAIYRLIRPETRTTILYRPLAVVLLRIATYVIRAVQAGGDYAEGLFIAEQILLLSATSLLVEPLVSLLHYHIKRDWIPSPPSTDCSEQKKVTWLERGLYLQQLALWASFILGIVAGSQAGDAATDPDKAALLRRYRYASISLTLLILVLSGLIAAYVHWRDSLPLRGTAFLLGCNAILVISTLYRLIVSLPSSSPSPTSSSSKAIFYILHSLPELLVTVLYFLANLEDMFAVREGEWKVQVEKRMGKEGEGAWPRGMGYVGREEYRRMEEDGEVEMGSVKTGEKA
ncbi:hypothetical protein JCM6882_002046 [Rhodosporidiobolus microsporus]